jgi:hypothetical protein
MPNPYVKKIAAKGEHSEDEVERRWKKAKKLAADRGESGNYAYITGIFKRMVGEALTYSELHAILVVEEGEPTTAVGDGTRVDNPEGPRLTKKVARRKKKRKDEKSEYETT